MATRKNGLTHDHEGAQGFCFAVEKKRVFVFGGWRADHRIKGKQSDGKKKSPGSARGDPETRGDKNFSSRGKTIRKKSFDGCLKVC